jgi:hypothetical protein
MYKEMHKITDITVKNGVVYFLSEVMLIENDIKTGHISVSRSSQEVLPVMKKHRALRYILRGNSYVL